MTKPTLHQITKNNYSFLVNCHCQLLTAFFKDSLLTHRPEALLGVYGFWKRESMANQDKPFDKQLGVKMQSTAGQGKNSF